MAGILYLSAFMTTVTGFGIAACIVGWQAVRWFRFGIWSQPTARDILDWASIPTPSLQRGGVGRIVDGLLALPATVTILVASLIIAGVIWLFAAERERQEDELRQAQLDEEFRKAQQESGE